MASEESRETGDRPDGEAPHKGAPGERRWPERWRDIIQIATRVARFADYLAQVWHDWTGGGPRWPTRW